MEQQVNVPFTMNNVYKMFNLIVGTQKERMDKVLCEAFDKICSYAKENSEAGDHWKTNSNYKINKKFIYPHLVDTDSWDKNKISISYRNESDIDDIIKALCYVSGRNYDDFISLRQFISYRYKLKINGKFSNDYNHLSQRLDDMTRVKTKLYETGINAEIIDCLPQFGEWYEWTFFKIKCFKKGTIHFQFIDENVWYKFNQTVAKIKGWVLPTKTSNK